MDIGAGLKGLIGLSCVFFSMDDWDVNGKTVVRWSVPAEDMAKRSGAWTCNPDFWSLSSMSTINWSYLGSGLSLN